jgi:hypothetical protein
MALNFSGEAIVPQRGVNLTGRKTTGVRVSSLKKGQKVITIGSDVLETMGLTDLGDGIKVKAVKGTGAVWGGKLMIQPADDGPLTLRYVSKGKKTAAHVMSASLPFDVSAKAKFKVYPEDKALVIMIPTENDAPAKEGEAATGDKAAAPAAAKEGDADFSA